MKKFYKGLIATVLIVVAVLSTVVPSYATAVVVDAVMGNVVERVLKYVFTPTTVNEGEDELIAAKNYLDSVWRLESNASCTVDVTYQSLSDVVSQLNMNGVPCQIKQLRGAGVTGYVIMGTGTTAVLDGYGRYDLTRKYFTNTAGAMFRADKDSGGSSDVTVDTSGIIQMLMTIQSAIAGVDNSLGTIISRLSSFSADAINRLWNIDQTLAEIYYYGNIHLQQLNDRVQSAGDHLGIIESYLQIYLADMAADIHTTALESTRIRSATESIEDYALNISTYTAGAYNGVNTIADLIVGWPEKFDQMNDYLRGIGSNSSDIYLTNKSILSAVDSIKTNTAAILSKLNNLTVSATSDYDDTTLLNRLDAISSAMQMFGGRLSSISQNTGALLDLFSLGEKKTLTVAANNLTQISFTESTDIQSVTVCGNDDSGFVLFASGGFVNDLGALVFAECDGGSPMSFETTAYFRTVDVPTDTLTITVKAHNSYVFSPRVPAGTYTVSLYDPSGALISLAAGDKLRPSSTVGRWEVLRTDGGVVSIASCTGLPDGCEFADLNPRCVRVPVRDIVVAPSLLISYARAFGSWFNSEFGSSCILVNTSGESLTVEYVAPSPLLNWYANRQDDFRYWLDTRLNNLPVGKPTDLTAVQATLTSLESTLSNADYFAPVVTNFNTNIDSLLDKLDIVIEGTSESVENRINVTIDASNDAHNVFYVTGEDGEEQSVTEFTGDLTKASGRLLSLLYRLVFADALSTVDGDLDGFEDFFTSQEQAEATQDINTPYEEENVWLAS